MSASLYALFLSQYVSVNTSVNYKLEGYEVYCRAFLLCCFLFTLAYLMITLLDILFFRENLYSCLMSSQQCVPRFWLNGDHRGVLGVGN